MQKFKLNKNYAINDVMGFTVLKKNNSKSKSIMLNETGSFIVNLLQGIGSSTDDIVSKITKEYNISKKDATDYVNKFLNNLIAQKIVEAVNE